MFCNNHGYTYNFYSPRSFQQNSMVELKIRNLQDMAQTMICEHSLPHKF